MNKVNIIGSGLAGLSASITLAKAGIPSRLISIQPSERSQSVLAEGGINAALDTMGEGDSTTLHFEDTMKAGGYLADEEAVRGLCERAPEIVDWLASLGVPFHREDGQIVLRSFGGQSRRRTAYIKSSTGKVLVNTLTDEVRRWEVQGLVERYSNHEFIRLLLSDDIDICSSKINKSLNSDEEFKVNNYLNNNNSNNNSGNNDSSNNYRKQVDNINSDNNNKKLSGIRIRDIYTDEVLDLYGSTILASGGLTGLFEGHTTGSAANTGDVTAIAHAQGVGLKNLEMIQYHPTTYSIAGKRCLISEAARGEGGRLYVVRDGKPWYFMEEKYPELGNLMPRDVVSREIYYVTHDDRCADQVYLDMTDIENRSGLGKDVWSVGLSDLRDEIISYMGIDPAKIPIPIEPGIHYFMGGIEVDVHHRTNIAGLYAAGECACQYHGANRLGGNSLLGAIYGGTVAAEDIISQDKSDNIFDESLDNNSSNKSHNNIYDNSYNSLINNDGIKKHNNSVNIGDIKKYDKNNKPDDPYISPVRAGFNKTLSEILYEGLSIIRTKSRLIKTRDRLTQIGADTELSPREKARVELGIAMVEAALARDESLGAHSIVED